MVLKKFHIFPYAEIVLPHKERLLNGNPILSLNLHLGTILPVDFCCENIYLDVRKMRTKIYPYLGNLMIMSL